MKLGPRPRKRGQIDKILVRKRATVARMRAAPPLGQRRAPGGGVVAAVSGERPGYIVNRDTFDNGLHEPSLLFVACDAGLAGGSYDLLFDVRVALERAHGEARPRLVAFDFVIHPVQLERAAGSGADAALLIARIVDREALADLFAHAQKLGLEPIIQCCSSDEVERAIGLGASIIAVSARDRDHGRLEVERALKLATEVQKRARSVALSVPPDMVEMFAESFDRVLLEVPESAGSGPDALVVGAKPA